jgi:sulfite oxidase
MGRIKAVSGVGWDDGVIANCRWAGVRLRDVLSRYDFDVAALNGRHCCFASYATLCQDDEFYGSSVPLEKAVTLDGDVLLAYEVCSAKLYLTMYPF